MSHYRKEIGTTGESLAEAHLRKAGYTIVERNFRCPYGEVDLIALEKDTIVFVEVKARMSEDAGSPFEAVGPHKQRQIARVAQYYLRRERLLDRRVRFDVIGIVWDEGEARIELLRDAFWA